MKTAVIYFSYEGNCAMIGEQIHKTLNGDMLRLHLEDDKPRRGLAKYFWGGRQVMLHKNPALKPYSVTIEPYDLIVIGAPVWAGSPAPPLHTFLEQTKITGKKIALFCCHAGGKGKALEKMRAMVAGNTIVGEIDFVNPAKQDKQEVIEKLERWLQSLEV
jgi:flavodoxin